jgi:hypothetical protein
MIAIGEAPQLLTEFGMQQIAPAVFSIVKGSRAGLTATNNVTTQKIAVYLCGALQSGSPSRVSYLRE